MAKPKDTPEPIHAAILMLDVKGYSKMLPWSYEQFFGHLLPAINNYLTQARYKNSWGDGIIAVFSDAHSTKTAATAALNILRHFKTGDVASQLHSPEPVAVRIALHFGQVHFGRDSIREGLGCFGEAITVCARVEPIIDPPNNAWCTQSFVSALNDITKGSSILFGYYERHPYELPKGAGLRTLYRLVDKSEDPNLRKTPEVALGLDPDCPPGAAKAVKRMPQKMSELPTDDFLAELRRTVAESMSSLEVSLYAHLPGSEAGFFGERSSHFRDEKKAIARYWMMAFRELLEDGPREAHNRALRLFLDSGTTVYEVFSQLLLQGNWNLLYDRKVEIITNNVPGLKLTMEEKLLQAATSAEKAGFYSLIKMLPGAPLPRYRAIVSDETISYLKTNYKCDKEHYNVVVTTGNFATFDGGAIYARNYYHRLFKAALMDLADEVWVLLPLGKIVPNNWNEQTLNNLVEPIVEPLEDAYEKVEIPSGKKQTIISTSRTHNELLLNHFHKFQQAAKDRTMRIGPSARVQLLLTDGTEGSYSIKDVCRNTGISQEELEFPHDWMRKPEKKDRVFTDYAVSF